MDVRDLDEFIEKNKVREETAPPYHRRLDKSKDHMLSDAIT
jgi:hypothetical protein